MDGSFLQRVKLVFHMLLPLSGDAILILAGLCVYLATCIITRHALTWAWALVPGLCLALVLEAWEIWDHYGLPGLSRQEPHALFAIVFRHARDVLITNLGPLAVFLAAHLLARIARA